MAEYGLWTWAPGNAPEITPDSFTVRIVYSALVTKNPPNISGARNAYFAIPGVDPSTHSAICIPSGEYPKDPNAQNSYAAQFEPQVVAGGVYVWFANRAQSGTTMALGTQRLLVMRYR
jgi:hypothetical protein